jgi:hypothetical protein
LESFDSFFIGSLVNALLWINPGLLAQSFNFPLWVQHVDIVDVGSTLVQRMSGFLFVV